MISQLQSIRSFVDNKLSDVLKWSDCVPDSLGNADTGSATVTARWQPDPEHTIVTRYRISCTSSFVNPPMGELVMIDLQDRREIRGMKTDAVWDEIARYIRRRMKDETAAEPQIEPASMVAPLPAALVYADDRKPHLGQGVTFYCERGEPMGGMMQLAAMVTEVISPTTVSLTVFPKTGEQFWRNDVPRRHATRQFFCWEFSEPLQQPTVTAPPSFELAAVPGIEPGAVTPMRRRGRPPKAATG